MQFGAVLLQMCNRRLHLISWKMAHKPHNPLARLPRLNMLQHHVNHVLRQGVLLSQSFGTTSNNPFILMEEPTKQAGARLPAKTNEVFEGLVSERVINAGEG